MTIDSAANACHWVRLGILNCHSSFLYPCAHVIALWLSPMFSLYYLSFLAPSLQMLLWSPIPYSPHRLISWAVVYQSEDHHSAASLPTTSHPHFYHPKTLPTEIGLLYSDSSIRMISILPLTFCLPKMIAVGMNVEALNIMIDNGRAIRSAVIVVVLELVACTCDSGPCVEFNCQTRHCQLITISKLVCSQSQRSAFTLNVHCPISKSP